MRQRKSTRLITYNTNHHFSGLCTAVSCTSRKIGDLYSKFIVKWNNDTRLFVVMLLVRYRELLFIPAGENPRRN